MVLGAGGFIGRRVVLALERSGATVDAVSRGQPVPDLTASGAVEAVIAERKPDIVFNLAGYGVNPAQRDPGLAERINAGLPGRVAEAMAHAGTAWRGMRVVHTGSALEYGTATGDLEESTVCTPTTLYGQTKLEGTQRLTETATARNVCAVTARIFTVYGPGEIAGRLLPTLMAAARSSAPVELTEGRQRRDFTYVDDVAEGLLMLGLYEKLPPVLNLATGTLTTVRDFILTASRVLGIDEARLKFGAVPTRAEEQGHDPVNIQKLRILTGWVPTTTIAEGVRRTLLEQPALRSPSA